MPVSPSEFEHPPKVLQQFDLHNELCLWVPYGFVGHAIAGFREQLILRPGTLVLRPESLVAEDLSEALALRLSLSRRRYYLPLKRPAPRYRSLQPRRTPLLFNDCSCFPQTSITTHAMRLALPDIHGLGRPLMRAFHKRRSTLLKDFGRSWTGFLWAIGYHDVFETEYLRPDYVRGSSVPNYRRFRLRRVSEVSHAN